ncbi:MAG: kynureninase [Deltaproteobacteria bacterium]|nr:kynureninase [Deltaproteobacteria bacterium]MBI3295762.1 kynureninase [Deltaproteobacteria bacterium]
MKPFEKSLACAQELDRQDPLARFRAKFFTPQHQGRDTVYLTGNSLGLEPIETKRYLEAELEQWRTLGVEGHLKGKFPWLPYHEFLTEPLCRLTGARPSEVVAMNSLTVNLHLMMVSFYRPTTDRHWIVIEDGAFSSDRYAVQSQAEFHGFAKAVVRLKTESDSEIIRFIEENGEKIALVILGQPNYITGRAFDLEAVARATQKAGVVFGVDLAHGIGNLSLNLHDWEIDFAVWCSYKYLNAGPGAIAGCFVHEKHHAADVPQCAGWWGHDKKSRFLMTDGFKPIPTVERWQVSNPPIFQAAALRASLSLFDEAGMGEIRKKSERLTAFMEFLNPEAELLTPRESARRGSQLSFRHKSAEAVVRAMKAQGIIADFRFPDVIRVAPVPFYNSYEDVWHFSEELWRHL